MKKLILSLFIIALLIPASACFADGATDQLMAMLQMKMDEVSKLKLENESLRTQLNECKAGKIAEEPVITRPNTGTQNTTGTCTNQAEFIEDVTIPDGSKVSPGERFVKTWRLRNTGTCAWTTGYKVVSIGRFRMGGDQYAYLPHTVRPGEMVDISIMQTAPVYIGDYASEYKLQDEKGNLFGIIGTISKKELSFWLKIDVVDKSKCALVSMTPSSVSRNSDFDVVFTVKNNSGETWHSSGVDVRMTNGKEFLKFDKSYIDLPKSVDPGNTVNIIYDMIASEDSGNHGITLEFIKDGGVYCTVYGNVTFK